MIKSYILDDGSEFKTVTLPKGTILFRGFNFQESDDNTQMYKEFIDTQGCCSPDKNVFFYPAPYVSNAVENYNVHTIYHTTYDLELLLMIKPSTQYRFNKINTKNPLIKIIKRCSEISEKDSCGHRMSESDPCFTEALIKNYPNILGYLGLNRRDVGQFFRQYESYITSKLLKYISHILPSVVSNSRDLVGLPETPEIVLHPLHFRNSYTDSFDREFLSDTTFYKYFIRKMSRFNYIPLLYVTKNKIYHFSEMNKEETVKELKNTEPPDFYEIDKNNLFKNMSQAMSLFLSNEGYIIDNNRYNFKIDKRTGFYIVKINEETQESQEEEKTKSIKNTINTRKTRKIKTGIMIITDPVTEVETTAPFSYTPSSSLTSGKINGWKSFKADLPYSEKILNTSGHSMTPDYIFDKGQYKLKYKIESVFRPKVSQIIKSTLKFRKSST